MAFGNKNQQKQGKAQIRELNCDFGVRNVHVWDDNHASFILDLPGLGMSIYNMRAVSLSDGRAFVTPPQVKDKCGEYQNIMFIKFSDEMQAAILKEVNANA